MLRVEKYNEEFKSQWDNFVTHSKNGTFLFYRDFMEYHKARFIDLSLLIFDKDILVAILPANKYDDFTIISHQGLTYGGLLINSNLSFSKVFDYLEILLKWLYTHGFEKLRLKHLPDFYSNCSQYELEYAYFLLNSNSYRLDTAFVYEYDNIFNKKLPKGRKSEIKKALRFKIEVIESDKFDEFWNQILIPNLRRRFETSPVHSLDEIILLKSSFPKNIKQFNALLNGSIVAGVTIFETTTTAHAQYLSGNDEARRTGALDYLFSYVVDYYSNKKKYFDFGIVNENEGRKLNIGMLKWKESFGARVFLHKYFEIQTKNYKMLNLQNLSI